MPRTHKIEDYRNFGIMAHIDAGKTTTTERILYYTGKSHKIGEVHDGAATMDWMEQEQERGITITSAATTAFWKAASRLNRSSTPPGTSTSPSKSSAACASSTAPSSVLDGNAGVEPQSETADKYKVPRIVFVNKMDSIGADFYKSVESIRDRLGASAVPIQFPIGSEEASKGLVDLVQMKAVVLDNDGLGAKYKDEDIPADLMDKALEARNYLIENAVELDDEAMEAYLGGEEPWPKKRSRSASNKGVQPLLDAVVDYLPSPVDIPPTKGHRLQDRSRSRAQGLGRRAPIMNDPFVGSLTFFRIYSGKLETGDTLMNSAKDKKERVGRMLLMHSNNREDIKEAYAGDIVALAGLKETPTGDTLCDPLKSPVILERMEFPEPVIEIAVEPKSKADQEKDGRGPAEAWPPEDPSFRVSTDQDATYKVEANIGAPQVAYRESLSKKAEIDYTHKKQTGGTGQFARVKLVFEPGEPGTGFVFESAIVGGAVPKEYIPGVVKGLETATLMFGSYHDVDSSVLAFEIASRAAFKEAARKGPPKLLEPIMAGGSRDAGRIPGLGHRRPEQPPWHDPGAGHAWQRHGGERLVPLANMFGYVNTLRGMSQGRAQFTMQFDHYEQVPQHVADEVIKKYA
ncbi:Elongation factor G [Aphelenchoides fujianensis]|nr:Elongation factor G [Aphelenchoides fujianensis]